MSKSYIKTELAPAAVGIYSQGVEVNGIFYFSGMLGIDPTTGVLNPSFDKQLTQILDNINGVLRSQSLQREDIVKTTIFMTDLSQFAAVNSAYEKFFKAPYPARTTVEVKGLPKSALIEIEVVAIRAN